MNPNLHKITALSVKFYASPLVLFRYNGSEKVDGEIIQSEKIEIEIQALIRKSTEKTAFHFPEMERIEGDVVVHSESELIAPDEKLKIDGDVFISKNRTYRIVMVSDSKLHGGFYKALARIHHV